MEEDALLLVEDVIEGVTDVDLEVE